MKSEKNELCENIWDCCTPLPLLTELETSYIELMKLLYRESLHLAEYYRFNSRSSWRNPCWTPCDSSNQILKQSMLQQWDESNLFRGVPQSSDSSFSLEIWYKPSRRPLKSSVPTSIADVIVLLKSDNSHLGIFWSPDQEVEMSYCLFRAARALIAQLWKECRGIINVFKPFHSLQKERDRERGEEVLNLLRMQWQLVVSCHFFF